MSAVRTNWIPPATVIALIAITTLGVLTTREPRFEGRTAGEWFDSAVNDQANPDRYGAIFPRWNDRGIRYLVQQLESEPPRWKQVLINFNNRHGRRFGFNFIRPSPTGERKRTAKRLLGYFEDKAAPRLISVLHSTSAANRVESIQAMAELGPAAARLVGPELVPLLKDPSDVVAYEAMTTLAVVGYDPHTVVPLLVPFLQHSNNRVRIEASYALGSYPPAPEVTLEPLLTALNDSDQVVQENAARALGAMGVAAGPALEPLGDLLRIGGLPSARAVEAIALINGEVPPELSTKYSRVHSEHLTGANDYNRLMVLHASVRLDWPVESLERTCRSLLDSRSNWQVWEAVEVLAERHPGPGWVTSLLEKAAKHPNGFVRARAREPLDK